MGYVLALQQPIGGIHRGDRHPYPHSSTTCSALIRSENEGQGLGGGNLRGLAGVGPYVGLGE